MKLVRRSPLVVATACGAALGAAIVANAQPDPRPTVVHVSGATLLENYLNQPAATLDFIDIDGNRASRGYPIGSPERQVQQVAPFDLPPLFLGGSGSTAMWDASTHLAVCYSSVGSGNGLNELVLNGRTFNLGPSGRTNASGGPRPAPNANMSMGNRSGAYFNRYRYINSGVGNNADVTVGIITNDGNPGGFPFRAETAAGPNQFKVLYTTPAFEAFTDSVGAGFSTGNFDEPFFDYNGNGTADAGDFTDLDSPTNGYDGAVELFTDANGNGRWDWLPSSGPGINGSTIGTEGLTVQGGVTVDISILDVPVRYAARQSPSSSAAATLLPGQPGYGNNTRLATLKSGAVDTVTNGAAAPNNANTLSNLAPSGVPAANINTAAPDANTIFDTPLFFAPIAPTANFGVEGGLVKLTGADAHVIRMSDLQYLFGAGRASNGENLMVVTRDSGSGTRNGFQNSIGQDPSWGVGENLGARNNSLAFDRAGSGFFPSNKNGNPRVEESVYNSRLAVGYVGPERGLSNNAPDVRWLDSGYADILSVINDAGSYAGTTAQRPTLNSILDNGTGNSWVIGGPAALGTFGNPRANAAADGGYGWTEPYSDTNSNGSYDIGEPYVDYSGNGSWGSADDTVVPTPAPAAFPMRNAKAAAFVNNISRSIQYFENFATPFTPGELAATQFILTNALPRVQNPNNPTDLITNSTFNVALQNFIRTMAGNIQANPQYASFASQVGAGSGKSRAGKVPSRIAGGSYSDSSINPQAAIDGSYITQGGSNISGGTGGTTGRQDLALRNLIAGDFNADGKRDINDASNMIAAWRQRTGLGGPWASPAATGDLAAVATAVSSAANAADACIEILGDYNTDGSFDKHDLRYWADGLGLAVTGPRAGKVDRKAAFTALDTELGTATSGADINVFDTRLAPAVNNPSCGKAYVAGDSRGDVANSTGRATKGFQPIGAEGYIGSTIAGADANIIDGWDIDYIYAQFRQAGITGCSADWSDYTEALRFDLSADINGDLSVNQADADEVVRTILGTCYGDVDLNGVVNTCDITVVTANQGRGGVGNPFLTTASKWSQGDLNGDNIVDARDLCLVTYSVADINCSGAVSVQDIFDFLSLYFSTNCKADVNCSTAISVQDIFDFLSFYFGAAPCIPGSFTCP